MCPYPFFGQPQLTSNSILLSLFKKLHELSTSRFQSLYVREREQGEVSEKEDNIFGIFKRRRMTLHYLITNTYLNYKSNS